MGDDSTEKAAEVSESDEDSPSEAAPHSESAVESGERPGDSNWHVESTRTGSVGSGASVQRSTNGETGAGAATGHTYTDYDAGPNHQALSERYGLDFCKRGQAQKVQRLESEFGSDRVSRWTDEGMTVETMGKPQDMQAFRERKAERSEEIPADIERQNQASFQRNVHRRTDESGEVGSAVEHLHSVGELRAKLAISSPNDPAEKEAEQVAAEVMKMDEPQAGGETTAGGERQRHREGETDSLQRSISTYRSAEGGAVADGAEKTVQSALSGGGKSLSSETRSYFEPRFGTDFSDVTVHTGSQADEAARSINAEAFTMGDDIAFAKGNYEPDSSSGKELIAHELTHVVQQGSSNGEQSATAPHRRRISSIGRQINRSDSAEFVGSPPTEDEDTTRSPQNAGNQGEQRGMSLGTVHDGSSVPDQERADGEYEPDISFEANEDVAVIDTETYEEYTIYEGGDPYQYYVDLPHGRVETPEDYNPYEYDGTPWVIFENELDELEGYEIVRLYVDNDAERFARDDERYLAETSHGVVNLETGEVDFVVMEWNYPDASGDYRIPEMEDENVELKYQTYDSIADISEALPGMYKLGGADTDEATGDGSVVEIDEQEWGETEYVGFDVSTLDRYRVWESEGTYGIIKEDMRRGYETYSITGATLSQLDSRADGLRVLKENPVGEETALHVIGGETLYEVRKVDGGYFVDIEGEGEFTSGVVDIDALGYRLPEGYTVRDVENVEESTSRYGGMEATIGNQELDNDDRPLEEQEVNVISFAGEEGAETVLSATDKREELLHEVNSAQENLDTWWELYHEYRTQYLDSGVVMPTAAGFVELISGSEFDESLYQEARTHFSTATRALSSDPIDFHTAMSELQHGKMLIPHVRQEWEEFNDGNIETAEGIVDNLEDVMGASAFVIEETAKARFGTHGGIVIGAIYEEFGLEAAQQLMEGNLDEDIEGAGETIGSIDWSGNLWGVVTASVEGILTDLIGDGIDAGVGKAADALGVDNTVLETFTEDLLNNSFDEIQEKALESVESVDIENDGLGVFIDELLDGIAEGIDEVLTLETVLSSLLDTIHDELGEPGLVVYEGQNWGEDVDVGTSDAFELGDDITIDGDTVDFVGICEELLDSQIEALQNGLQ